ncbi:MAG: PQQ-binding-like beta-propeller repeat protein [Caldisericia bacterium]|nr:PQQ-binding-like beta-propeller repeat protein [Caldisericia bacterium]
MRRTIVGVIVAALLLAQIPIINSKLAVASDKLSYNKVWETKAEDRISFKPAIAEDGSMYGVCSDKNSEYLNKLIKVKDGAVVWESEEEVGSETFFVDKIMLADNLVISAGLSSPDDDSAQLLFVCYNTDGKKLWDKQYGLSTVLPSYELHNKNIWMIFDNSVRVIDAKTGEETHKIDLESANTQPSPNGEGDDDDVGIEDFQLYFLSFSGNTLLINQLYKIRAYDVAEDFTLKLKWQKDFDEDDWGMMFLNMLLGAQANQDVLIAADSEASIKCFNPNTGEEMWTLDFGDSFLALFMYDQSHMIMMSLTGTSCFDVKTKKLLWQKDSLLFPRVMDKDVFVTVGSIENLNLEDGVEVFDINNGEKLCQIDEKGVSDILVSGDNLYIIKTNQISMYSKSVAK